MSCALLDKLAPETRTLIYEYALAFDTPLKHVHKMRPFTEKLTKSTQSTKSKTETVTSEEPYAANEFYHRVNTSILTTSKLIYTEAIPVFYKHNIINIDASLCKNVSTLHTTDLSLATQVTVESVLEIDPKDGSMDGLGEISRYAIGPFWLIFPKLKTVTVYVNTDAHPTPVSALFAIIARLKSAPGFSGVKFDGVGSAVASSICPSKNTKFCAVVQCRTTVARWANEKVISDDDDDVMAMSMRVIHDHCKANSPPGTVASIARSFFNRTHDIFVPIDYPTIEPNSYEFWTVADECLRHMQLDFLRQ